MESTSPPLYSISQALSDSYRPGIIAPMLNSKADVCRCVLSNGLEETQYKLSGRMDVRKSGGFIGSVQQAKWISHSWSKDHRFQKTLYETTKSFLKLEVEFDRDLRPTEFRLREGGRCPLLSCNRTARTAVARL